MRSQEEIEAVFEHPGKFLKCDIYKVGLLELVTLVPFEKVPKKIQANIPADVAQRWNPEEERKLREGNDEIFDELSYLRKMLRESIIVEAVYRTPRLFALAWLHGSDISKVDEELHDIITKHVKVGVAKTKLLKIYTKIEGWFTKKGVK